MVPFPKSIDFPQPEAPGFGPILVSDLPRGRSAPPRSYESELEAAVRSRNKSAVRGVLDAQSHPWFGRSLIVAAECGEKEIAELLINKGAGLDDATGESGTALRVAAKAGNLNIMRLLLAKGASVDIGPGNQGTALKAAVEAENIQAVKLLLDHGASPDIAPGTTGSAFIAAAKIGNLEILRLLLDNGADIEGSAGNSGTPLRAAALAGNIEAVDLLLQRGARIGAAPGPSGDPHTETPLAAAARVGNESMVKHLLDRGAVVNDTAWGALVAAKRGGHKKVVELLLLAMGAHEDVHAKSYVDRPIDGKLRRIPSSGKSSTPGLFRPSSKDSIPVEDLSRTVAPARLGRVGMGKFPLDDEAIFDLQNAALIATALSGHQEKARNLLSSGAARISRVVRELDDLRTEKTLLKKLISNLDEGEGSQIFPSFQEFVGWLYRSPGHVDNIDILNTSILVAAHLGIFDPKVDSVSWEWHVPAAICCRNVSDGFSVNMNDEVMLLANIQTPDHFLAMTWGEWLENHIPEAARRPMSECLDLLLSEALKLSYGDKGNTSIPV